MRKQRGQTLAATMIVVAIILMLAVVFMTGRLGGTTKSSRADGKGTTIPGLAMARAHDEDCRTHLGQIRMSLQIQQTSDDAFPQSLADTRLGDAYLKCPLGGEKYDYEPATGKVSCPHPGHEKY